MLRGDEAQAMSTGGRPVSPNAAADSLIAPRAPSNSELKLASARSTRIACSIHAVGSWFAGAARTMDSHLDIKYLDTGVGCTVELIPAARATLEVTLENDCATRLWIDVVVKTIPGEINPG
jgi:hypothetical protein